jgi:hypothetical protein
MPTANSCSRLKGPLLIPEFLYGHVLTAQLETQPEKPPEFPAGKASKENRNHTNIFASFFPDPLRSHITKDISLDPSLSPKASPIASQFIVIPDAISEYFTNTLLAVSMVCRGQS